MTGRTGQQGEDLARAVRTPAGRGTSGPLQLGASPLWAVPATLWMGLFFLVPLLMVAFVSFCHRGPHGGIVPDLSVENFVRALDPLYVGIYVRSLRLAASTTLACALIGLPMAWMMATARPRMQRVLVVAVMVPFLTNFVIRAYGIKILLGRSGPISHGLMTLGFIDQPQSFTDSALAVWFGMVTNYLPFMVLPLFASLERFDFRLMEAAADLGARGANTFVRIVLPLLARPVLAGATLVFIPAFGEFIIPDLLGGARQMLIGNLLTEQFLKARDWPFGSAVAMIMFAVVFALGLLLRLIQRADAQYLRRRSVR